MINWALPDALWYRQLPVTSFFKRMIFWPSGHWYDEVSVYKVAWAQRSLAPTETCRPEPSLSCMSTTVDNFIIKKTFPFLEGKDSAWAGGGGGFIRTGTLLNCLFEERYCDFRNNYLNGRYSPNAVMILTYFETRSNIFHSSDDWMLRH